MKVAETKISMAKLTTVPVAIRKAMSLAVGDYLEWHIEEGQVIVKQRGG